MKEEKNSNFVKITYNYITVDYKLKQSTITIFNILTFINHLIHFKIKLNETVIYRII
jgi:hypothetical protein